MTDILAQCKTRIGQILLGEAGLVGQWKTPLP